MPHTRRRSYETGHRPKFLVVVDGTPECERAARFAARRVARTGAILTMLAVINPPDAFEWLGVGDVMQAEAEAEAAQTLESAAARARAAAGVEPERVTRIGSPEEEILKLIDEDADVSYLVLAAGAGKEGPGPLVSNVAGKAASTYPVPVIIVPGSLTDEEIDAIAG
ncbi:universal stress protein [Salinarimonas soli]|uniref:Universal stress protein n=1 Tax=Salinarimonas soli TaxID=1638099 RepID=A0A5B2VBW8_9HYPH|nr:universal stress protein [Salinarimonas soli]KAA2235960.1 universal stress protein [Salinarimonas soli]